MLWRAVVLNRAGGKSTGEVVDVVQLARDVQKTVKVLLGQFLSEDGSRVDYDGMRASALFAEFEATTSDLKHVEPSRLARDDRLAFFLNVYNAMTVHVIAVCSPPTHFASRLAQNTLAKYDIGGQLFSLHDIENGVLRGNRASPFDVLLRAPPFGRDDPRRATVIEPADPRVHFAINCGARSCPPIRFFTAENTESALAGATSAFLRSENGVVVTDDAVHLSAIFKWYAADFGGGGDHRARTNALAWILQQLDPDDPRRGAIRAAMDDAARKVQWLPYDWSSNAKDVTT